MERLITEPMSLEKLRKFLPPDSHAVLYKELDASALKHKNSVVVLYETQVNKKKIGHFIVILKRPGGAEYFSSLGRSPADEQKSLSLDSEKFKTLVGKNYSYNKTALQNSQNYRVNDCGRWCIARVLLANMSISEFVALIHRKNVTTDQKIAFASLLLDRFVQI